MRHKIIIGAVIAALLAGTMFALSQAVSAANSGRGESARKVVLDAANWKLNGQWGRLSRTLHPRDRATTVPTAKPESQAEEVES